MDVKNNDTNIPFISVTVKPPYNGHPGDRVYRPSIVGTLK